MPEVDELKDPFAELDAVATAPVLLVATDYDGTLAPIVSDPSRAFPHRETMVALKALAGMANTPVALISGRALRDLATLTGSPNAVHLVGSHGSEFDPGFAASLSPEACHLLERVIEDLQEIASSSNGVHIERKPAGVAFHYRKCSDDRAESLRQAVLFGPAKRPGVYVRSGKKVIELSVVATDKGVALETIRSRVGASVAIFLGDDETDEDAFVTLRGPDLGIKVGTGTTGASYHLRDTTAVAHFLAALAERRSAWLTGARAVPLENHSFLSDQRTVALVDHHARINWFCIPRLDSPAIFGELVGGPTAGFFAITDGNGNPPQSQSYHEGTLILRSRWPNFEVVDYLDCSGGRPLQRPGRTELVRRIQGEATVTVEFAPRLDFGRTATRLRILEDGLEVQDAPDPVVLRAPGVAWELSAEGNHQTARATIALGDKPVVLELRCGTRSLDSAIIPESLRAQQCQLYWSDWSNQLQIPSFQSELVKRSALVLKGLCFGPTGGIAAAATTSLPEHLGGVRNWDYRYCWLRDAAMSAEALVRLGSLGEGMRFLDWVLDAVEKTASAEKLRPVYAVSGEELGIEAEITELGGYAGSRPVRIGNAAARQLQLDVFGSLMSLMKVLLDHGAPLSSVHWHLVDAVVGAVGRRWREPDHGIWEIRGPRRHFVHSKIMCWVAVDRAIAIGRRLVNQDRDDWKALRDEIAADVVKHGWKEHVKSFVAAYDGTDLDAATLSVGLCGLLPPDDHRFVSTIATAERFLLDGPVVYRYRFDDGLPGVEGGFHICTSWLIDAYILTGRIDAAQKLFSELVQRAGPTGIFSEEYDPHTRTALGNCPQAYTHLGVINNALNLATVLGEG